MPLIKELFIASSVVQPQTKGRYSGVLVDNDTFFGVEIELEGLDPTRATYLQAHGPLTSMGEHAFPNGVMAHYDGSLRGGGIEFVTKPLNGRDLFTAVVDTCAVAKAMKLKTSNRAGVHVHVDTQTMTLEQWTNFIMLYILIEPAVFKAASKHRGGSLYCKSWYEGIANEELAVCLKTISGGTWMNMASRYLGLNINSTRKYGTLEFRHLQSTTDPDVILEWINVLAKMRQYALKADFNAKSVAALTHDGLLREVFGMDYYKYMPEDYMSYFYQHCIPLWFEVFTEQPKAPVSWDRKKGPTTVHRGFTLFAEKQKAKATAPLSAPKRKLTAYMDLPTAPAGTVTGNHAYQFTAVDDLQVPFSTPPATTHQPTSFWSDDGEYRMYVARPRYMHTHHIVAPQAHTNASGRVWHNDSLPHRTDIQRSASTANDRTNHGAGVTVWRYAKIND